MELKYILYITINLCNGKFYIGIHKTNPEVFDGYIGCGIYKQSDANKNFPFHRAVKKYGYNNFKRTILKIFPGNEQGKKEASELEKTLVNETMLKSKSTYNCSLGGFGENNPDSLKRVYMFDLNGEYLRSFTCARDAAIYIGLSNVEVVRQAIKNNCRGVTNSSFGYYWSYKKEFNYTNNNVVKVAQYTLNGKFLRYFDSITEAEVELNLNSIQKAIKKGFSCGGYQWRYYNGDSSDIPRLINVYTKMQILPINMYTKSGEFIASFDSVKKCIEEYPELKTSQINRVLNNTIKSHKGYVF